LVSQRDATVTLECPRELSGLMQHVPGVARTITRGDPIPPFDVHCPLMSLPRALALSTDTIPCQTPYLNVDENLRHRWTKRLSAYQSAFKVGIVWSGSRIHPRDAHRSIKLNEFEALGELEGVKLFSLQKSDPAISRTAAARCFELIDFTDELHDFSDTAALVMNLDLVIGVDTAVVHLAGALGRPVWTLLAYSPDWRWQLDRPDSPWYPTMRLFRQSSPGDWSALFQHVAAELSQQLSRR
jgi:hypothetical protein